MTNYEKEILEKFCPAKYEISIPDIVFSKLYERNKSDELRELEVHIENSFESDVLIEGGNEAIKNLKNIKNENIFILAVKTKKLFLKLYLIIDKEMLIGSTMIKRHGDPCSATPENWNGRKDTLISHQKKRNYFCI